MHFEDLKSPVAKNQRLQASERTVKDHGILNLAETGLMRPEKRPCFGVGTGFAGKIGIGSKPAYFISKQKNWMRNSGNAETVGTE